ncbi:putative F6A14.6 protein [Quillaja saponaria]|uniref:F6A14.6 protein n=1 Tax=Quillaja saponaria TaxID=32244 RepID=A0AAD7PI02_QUISA|nr:putative F6A14.6 protein [Quillaja saponaria]
MSLLEVITKAASNPTEHSCPSDYPIILNPDTIFPNLKPKLEDPCPSSLVNPLIGWKISETDSKLIDISKKFFTNLKNTKGFGKDEFISMLNSYLEMIRDKAGVSIRVDSSDSDYTRLLIEKLGVLMGKDVTGLVLEGCVALEIWELVEALAVSGIVEHSCYLNLITRLVEKKRSDLLCTCIKHAFDLGPSELLCVLKYFLSPSKDAYASMVNVRKEWENQALLAIEKASDNSLQKKKLALAKEASILLMIAYDGFSPSELCLHHLLSSSNIDDVMLAPAFSKLNGKEMTNLIQYLTKWLKKYERFPQAGPCPNASAVLGLKACDWVPKLEDVVKCLGLVLDENFSSLVLHPEFHEELTSMEKVVGSLTAEARLSFSMAGVIEKLKTVEVQGGKN